MPSPSLSHASDAVLVDRAQRGDREAMVLLYRRYVNEMLGYAYNQLGSLQDAEDLTSETFLRLVRSIGSFDRRASFRTWLYSIMRNQLRDHWRRDGRRPRQLPLESRDDAGADSDAMEAGVADAMPGTGEPDLGSETTQLGRALLEGLSDRDRRVLTLRILDGRSIRDSAAEMGVSEGNVKVMQHRALKRAAALAAELAQREEDATHHEA